MGYYIGILILAVAILFPLICVAIWRELDGMDLKRRADLDGVLFLSIFGSVVGLLILVTLVVLILIAE